MINKIINALGLFCLLASLIGAFYAVYLRHAPEKKAKVQRPAPQPAPQKLPSYLRVGIIGESRSNGFDKQSFNMEVVEKLFKLLKEKNVQAVFVTGNLVYGWLNSGGSQEYDSNAFREQLESFLALFKAVFGSSAELHPLMGSHEAIGPDAAMIFRQVFDIPDTIPPTNDFVAYSVSIGNAFFALLPTDYYDTQQNRARTNAIPPPALQWLKNTLTSAARDHRFLFVLGHEPAFMAQTLLSRAPGLDENTQQRDAFWKILKEHHVLAYFASRERMYDRSNRYGVWQVVSGGGGALLIQTSKVSANAFFHCIVLTLPQNDSEEPSMKVFDTDGHIRDEFELRLEPEQQPLFQMRISSLFI